MTYIFIEQNVISKTDLLTEWLSDGLIDGLID